MERLRDIREQAGYSQQDLADESGVSQHTISEIELGHRKPQGRTLRKLATVLGVEVAELVGATRPKESAPPPEPTLFNGVLEAERRVPSVILDALSAAAENLANTPPPQSLLEVGQHMGMVATVSSIRTPLLAFLADVGEWIEMFASEDAERLVNITVDILEASNHVIRQTNEYLEREIQEAADAQERREAEVAQERIRELTERISA